METGVTAIEKFVSTVIEFCVNYSFQVFGALIILFVGWLAARAAANFMLKLMEKKKMDVTLSNFIATVVKVLVLSFAIIIALGKFGITIAPFIAALGALAFGASFAIQGPLSNYGAGLSIILSRPFVVGDTISVAGVSGVVEEVKLACTRLAGADGVQITIPNKHVVGEVLHNSKANKVIDGVIGISYEADPKDAIQTISELLSQVKEVVQKPAPQIGVREFADSSVNINYRCWVPTKKYYPLLFQINKMVYEAFQEKGIAIPYPQRDLHIVSDATNGDRKDLTKIKKRSV